MSDSPETELLVQVTRRLFIALTILFCIALSIAAFASDSRYVVPAVVIASGFIGGFVGLQRRLKDLTIPDLKLIARSIIYTCLSPLAGGVLALLLYVLFLSDLVSGQLFPHFVQDTQKDGASPIIGFSSLFAQHATDYKEYAKLVFWCFVAGFNERFVTDVISRFEGAAIKTIQQSGNLAAPQQDAAADAPSSHG